MFKGLEHPSAFPSMLRGSTPEPRPLTRKESFGSSNQLRRSDSVNNSMASPRQLQRKDSSPSRRDSSDSILLSRKDYNANALTRKNSGELKLSKRDSVSEDFRRLSFGNSIYLRPDSTGAINLIRRDSIGRKGLHNHARDFVSKLFEPSINSSTNNNEHNSKDISSILRRSDSEDPKKGEHDSNVLTTANLSKHVTIIEKVDSNADKSRLEDYLNNRRDQTDSLSSRRISVDSLDVRRLSRRGSSVSGEAIFNSRPFNDNEVIPIMITRQFSASYANGAQCIDGN